MANAAWLALTVLALNLGHAVGRLAGHNLEKATTLQRRVSTRPRPPRDQRTTPTSTTAGVLALG